MNLLFELPWNVALCVGIIGFVVLVMMMFDLEQSMAKPVVDQEEVKRNEEWLRTFYKEKAAELRGEG